MNEHQLRQHMCEIGRICYQKGYLVGYEGNLSIRLPDDSILITPSGLHKGFLEPEHLIIITQTGQRIDTANAINANFRSSSETPMHLEAYRQRPDINAVVHTHAPHAVALTLAGLSIADDMVPEVVVLLGRIPVTPYATPSSTENADAIRHVITTHDALVLERHGTLAVGNDLMQAFMRTETIEASARLAFMSALLGVDNKIPPEQLEKLHAKYLSMR